MSWIFNKRNRVCSSSDEISLVAATDGSSFSEGDAGHGKAHSWTSYDPRRCPTGWCRTLLKNDAAHRRRLA